MPHMPPHNYDKNNPKRFYMNYHIENQNLNYMSVSTAKINHNKILSDPILCILHRKNTEKDEL
jgi:hypothetical protein